MQPETLSFDVLIIGAGPAGLSTAIQLARKQRDLQICVIEKAAEIGGHIVSGAMLETAALDALIPDWQQLDVPVNVPVMREAFYYLTKHRRYRLPVPPAMKNHGNHIISLCELCRWLAKYATQLGVHVFAGFAGQQLLFNTTKDTVIGVQTSPVGANAPGVRLLAKQTVLAEGARGSLSEQAIKYFNLRQQTEPQTYAIGLKELWKIPQAVHQIGTAIHTVGWPLSRDTYGGGFIYHFREQLLAIGLVVGLDYRNPYLDPFQELQQLKRHPSIKPLLQGGECLSYGARALTEGGWQSLPKLTFPGGLLVGCAAGMVNIAKLKGIHNAIRSGMLAADAIAAALPAKISEAVAYPHVLQQSPIADELRKVRNLRAGFRPGLLTGLCYAAVEQYLLRGAAPWTFRYQPDHVALKPASQCKPIAYPKPDNTITFDKLTQIFLSHIRHREEQPCHLHLGDPQRAITNNLAKYAAPESRYCPAAVYTFVDLDNTPRLQISAANCIHCKTCDIKDPLQNITWQTPEGGSGPNYRIL